VTRFVSGFCGKKNGSACGYGEARRCGEWLVQMARISVCLNDKYVESHVCSDFSGKIWDVLRHDEM
jgi:hypothetical protein